MPPLYEYQCEKCEFKKEYLESLSQVITHYCGKCNEKMKKQISTQNFQFKGSGFYKTDYKDKGR